MTTSNIKRFDELTGQVLGVLYEQFPVPHFLALGQLVPDGYSYDEGSGGDAPNEQGLFFFACVDWLAESGYLRFKEKNHQYGYHKAVLTAKGLEVLKAIPESLSTGPTLGDQLIDASKSGAKGMLGKVAEQALSIGVRIASKQLGLPD
ncbi:hypothetical protein ACA087_06435 [Pseudomonas chlororaphis]|uniref:hypothetical protein n=1 Tax=Pseudomonas chlororaphis TaxID=587753 RepID=UPI00352BC3B3